MFFTNAFDGLLAQLKSELETIFKNLETSPRALKFEGTWCHDHLYAIHACAIF